MIIKKEFKAIKFDNGAELLVVSKKGMKISSVGAFVDFGSRYENDKQFAGIAHFIEHMLFKGTDKMCQKEIARFVEGNGGSSNAYTTLDHTCYYINSLNDFAVESIGVLCDMIANTIFVEKDFNVEMGVIKEEIARDLDDACAMADHIFNEYIYGDHPMGRPIAGFDSTVSKMKLDDIIRFHKKYYVAENLKFIIVGDISEHDIEKMSEKIKNIKSGEKSNYIPVDPDHISKLESYKNAKQDCEQSYIYAYRSAPSEEDPRHYTVRLINNILGGNMSSRMFQKLREDIGITYSAYSYICSMKDIGLWQMYASTRDARKEECAEAMKSIISNLGKEKITDEDIKDSKRYMIGRILRGSENASGMMMFIGRNYMRTGKMESPEEIIDQINKISRSEIENNINKFFNLDEWKIFVVSPKTNS